MDTLNICDRCKSKTKYVSSFGYGKNGSCYLYDCASRICPIARRRRKKEEAELHNVFAVVEENYANDISADDLKKARRKAGLLLGEVAEAAGISPAKLSAYENDREPIPKDVYRILMDEYGCLCTEKPKAESAERGYEEIKTNDEHFYQASADPRGWQTV